MAKGSGPRHKPSALRIIAGSLDERPPGEPVPPGGDDRPTPPSWLTKLARAEWDRICDSLWAMDCLSEIDQGMFAAYCQAWGRYEQAEIDLNASIAAELSRTPKGKARSKLPGTHGAVVKTKQGNLILNPLFGLVNSLRRDMQKLALEFGLSPSARAGLGTKGGTGGGKKSRDPVADKYFSNG